MPKNKNIKKVLVIGSVQLLLDRLPNLIMLERKLVEL